MAYFVSARCAEMGFCALLVAILTLGAATPGRGSAQVLHEWRPVPTDLPAAYSGPNLVRDEPVAAAAVPEPPPPPPVDVGARVLDEFLGALLGYGTGVGLAVFAAFLAESDEPLLTQALVGLFAPPALALGAWIPGQLRGGSRYDGALIGGLLGSALGLAMILALGGPSLEDFAQVSIGLLAPVIGSVAGAEIASAIGGVVRF